MVLLVVRFTTSCKLAVAWGNLNLPGNYHDVAFIMVEVSNKSLLTASDEILKSSVTDDPRSTIELEIYPNPTTGIITVDFKTDGSTMSVINVINSNGKMVKTISWDFANSITIDMRPFTSGLYYIRVTNDSNIMTKKLVKQ